MTTTTCPKCAKCYIEIAEEEANSTNRMCNECCLLLRQHTVKHLLMAPADWHITGSKMLQRAIELARQGECSPVRTAGELKDPIADTLVLLLEDIFGIDLDESIIVLAKVNSSQISSAEEAWNIIGMHYVMDFSRPEEKEAFQAGWQYREDYGHCPPVEEWNQATPAAKDLDLYPYDQNCRIAWEIGWSAKNGGLDDK